MAPRSTTRVLFAHHTAHDGKSLRKFSQWAATRFKLLKHCRAESEETADAVTTRLSHSLEHS